MTDRGWPDVPVDSPFRFVNYNGDDPLGFVISKNLQRRHLDESQRAMVAAKVANMRQGERTDTLSANLQKVSQAQAAQMVNVSTRSVSDAVKVYERGSGDLAKAVVSRQIPVSVAAKVADMDEETQAKAVAEPNRASTLVKQSVRDARERETAGLILALPDKKFGVILADPEWRFYRSGNDDLEYQPDFVAEMHDRIVMLEAKMASQMADKDVVAKRDVAIQWCVWASEHARTYSGKPWRYALIPHDAIAENVTIEFLLKQYG
jgi:hypothetical protein